MKNDYSTSIAKGALLALAAGMASNACAQNWPARPVRIIVPFVPGGGTDIQARLLGKKFFESMGQSFVVENRGGAGGLIGAELVAKSPPDGYNILVSTASLAVNVSLYKKIAFDPVRDLAPVSWISSSPLVLIVHPTVPAKSVKELVTLAKQYKGTMNAASNGSGTTSHLAIEMLKQMAKIEVTHVPYRGGGGAMNALLAGETDFRFTSALAVHSFVRAGRVRPLAVTTAKKSSVFPDLPTLASTYPGFECDNWYAVFVAAGTPKEIVGKLSAQVSKALQSPEMRDFITKEGAEPVGSTPEELAAYFMREIDKYAKVIKAAQIRLE
jgi:tripartite-type tricarboxylate transporter receptor subunit TctC